MVRLRRVTSVIASMLVTVVIAAGVPGVAAAASAPSVPTSRLVTGCVYVCAGANRTTGIVTGDSTPVLTGRSFDADGDALRYRFQLVRDVGSTQTTIADVTTAALRSGDLARYQVPKALPDGGGYRYRVVATDGARAGAWSPWMAFAVDLVPPRAPKISVRSAVSTNPDRFSGRVGETPVDITLSEQVGADRVWGYAWVISSGRTMEPTPERFSCTGFRMKCVTSVNGDLAVPRFTVPDDISTFTAWAIDAVGHPLSPASRVNFYAMDSRLAVRGHQWPIESGSPGCPGAAVPDVATAERQSLTIGIGGCRTRPTDVDPIGPAVSVMNFDGKRGYARTSQPIVDLSGSFSVAVWARPSATGVEQTVISQDGAARSGFELQLSADNYWRFCVPPTGSGAAQCVTSPSSIGRGEWMFVAGSYNASSNTIGLAVTSDGSASEPAENPLGVAVPTSSGPLAVGRGQMGGRTAHYWHGDVFLPTVLPGVVTPRQLSEVGQSRKRPSELCDVGCG